METIFGIGPAIFWLMLLVVLLVIEILTLGLTTVWFAGGSLIAFIAALCGAPIPVQAGLFLVVSFVLLFLTRPIAVKYFNKDRVRTNVENMIGKQAIVISEVDNLQGVGQVTVAGVEWSARAEQEKNIYHAGDVVTVTAVTGNKLIVTKNEEEVKS